MRILLTSDLHYRLRQYDWLIGAAAGFDATVIAGDHIDAFLPVPGAVQIAALSASFAAVAQKSRLLVCSGNHDLNAWNDKGEKRADWLDAVRSAALAVDGDTVYIGDTLFTVCPWWDGPHTRVGIERMLETASRQRTRPVGLGVPRTARGCPELDRQAPLWRCRAAGADSSGIRPPRSCAGTFTRPRSRAAGRGSTASATRGCSTPATRSATSRPESRSISRSRQRAGSRSPAWKKEHFNNPARRFVRNPA